jgi:hypothetical protein
MRNEDKNLREVHLLLAGLTTTNDCIVAQTDGTMRSFCALLFLITKGSVKVTRSLNCGRRATSISLHESCLVNNTEATLVRVLCCLALLARSMVVVARAGLNCLDCGWWHYVHATVAVVLPVQATLPQPLCPCTALLCSHAHMPIP